MDARCIAKKIISLTCATSGIVAGSSIVGDKKASKTKKIIGTASLVSSGAVIGAEVAYPIFKKIKSSKTKKKLEINSASETATV